MVLCSQYFSDTIRSENVMFLLLLLLLLMLLLLLLLLPALQTAM
jgi:hypothetical protein